MERRWIWELVARCQIVAGQLLNGDPGRILSDLHSLISELPEAATAADQLVVRRVLDQVLAQLSYAAHAENSPELSRAFLAFVVANPPPYAWRTELLRGIRRFAAAWADHAPELTRPDPVDLRVVEALKFIQKRAGNPRLRLADVARHSGLSPSYLVRLLKLRTGEGFSGHLHRTRVLEAQRRLKQTALTVKEIAAAVGYESSNQLDRHFKRHVGMTPVAYRRSM